MGTALELAWASEDPEVEDGARNPTHGSKAKATHTKEPSSFLEPQEAEPQLSGNVPVEDNEDKATGQFRKVLVTSAFGARSGELSREVDEGSKLSDVRQRRDARVKWEAWQRVALDCSPRNLEQLDLYFPQQDGIHAPRHAACLRLIRPPSKCTFLSGAL